MADKIKIIGAKDPDLVSVTDANVHYTEELEPGTYVVKYKGMEKKVTVTADGKVPVVRFTEPKDKEEKAKKPSKGTKVEAAVTTGIKVTSEPDQLVIYFNKAETQWRTPETLNLAPGIYVIGVEGNITGDGPVEVKAGEVTLVHIEV